MACELFFSISVGLRSLWQPGLLDKTPAGARLQGEGHRAAARHSPLVTWRAPRPARLTPAPARQEADRGKGGGPRKRCMEVEVGIADNWYPMHLSTSHGLIRVKGLCSLLVYVSKKNRSYSVQIVIHTIISHIPFVAE